MRHSSNGYRSRFSKFVYAFCIAFLFLPLVILVVYSFNEGKAAQWEGFGLVWYRKLFTDSWDLWRAFFNTLSIAFSSALVSTVMGTLAAIGMKWYEFKVKPLVKLATFLPLVLPEIILGVSLMTFFAGIHMPLGWASIFIAHVTFCVPFAFLMVEARLEEFDNSVIEASYDLGATERQTLGRVILPMAMPGIASGFIMSITLSLEDFVTTFFVSGAGSATLPIVVYGEMAKGGISPVINALSTIMIFGTVMLALVARNSLKYIAAK